MSSVFETMTGLMQQSDSLSRLATALGGNQADTAKAVNTVGPAVIGGLADKANLPGGIDEVAKLLDADDGIVLGDLDGFLDRGPTATGASTTGAIFGAGQQELVSSLAASAGLGGGLVASALPMLTPIVVGIFAKRRQEGALSNTQLATLLNSEKSDLQASGLLASVAAQAPAAQPSPAAAVAPAPAASPAVKDVTVKPKVALRWVWPAVGLVAVLVGLGWALSNLSFGDSGELATANTGVADTVAQSTAADTTNPASDEPKQADLQVELDDTLGRVSGAENVRGTIDAAGIVTLTGIVREGEPKAAAQTAVTGIRGVTSVENQIEVGAANPVASDLSLEPITFQLNSASITEQGKTALDEAATFFETNADLTFEVGGHTDDNGSDEANLALSVARANAVKAYLESKGISGDRITTKGYGKSEPKVANDSRENKAANRRIEFKIN